MRCSAIFAQWAHYCFLNTYLNDSSINAINNAVFSHLPSPSPPLPFHSLLQLAYKFEFLTKKMSWQRRTKAKQKQNAKQTRTAERRRKRGVRGGRERRKERECVKERGIYREREKQQREIEEEKERSTALVATVPTVLHSTCSPHTPSTHAQTRSTSAMRCAPTHTQKERERERVYLALCHSHLGEGVASCRCRCRRRSRSREASVKLSPLQLLLRPSSACVRARRA